MKWRLPFRKKREKKHDPDLYYSEVRGRIIPGVPEGHDDFYHFQTFGVQSSTTHVSQIRPQTLEPASIKLPSYNSGDFSIQSSTQESLAADEEDNLAYCPHCHTLVHPITKRRPKIRTNPWLPTTARQREEAGFPCQSASVTDSGISELVAQSEGSCAGQSHFPKSISDTFTTLLTPQEEEQSFVSDYECSPKAPSPKKRSESTDEDSLNEREIPEKLPKRVRRRKKHHHQSDSKHSRKSSKSPFNEKPSPAPKEVLGFLQLSSSEQSTPVHRMNYTDQRVEEIPVHRSNSIMASYLASCTPAYMDQACEEESLFSDCQTNISREAYVNYRRMKEDQVAKPATSFRNLSQRVESLEDLRLRLQNRIDQLHSDKLQLEAQFSQASLTQDLLSQEISEYRNDLTSRVQSQYLSKQILPSRRQISSQPLIDRSIPHVTPSAEQYFASMQPSPQIQYYEKFSSNNYPFSRQPQFDNFLYSRRDSQLLRDQRQSYGYHDHWGYTVAS